MELIYENDIPDLHTKVSRSTFSRLVQDAYEANRWKPNGITDNRKKWELKNEMHKQINKITAGSFAENITAK